MSTPRYFPVLPAAGVGSRMQADRPKQYLPIQGRFLLDYTLDAILSYPAFEQAVLVLSADDPYWPDSEYAADERIIRAAGGRERCDSVLNGLAALQGIATEQDWVVVHDIARPCLRHSDLDALLGQLADPGAILASPTRDTMKRGVLRDGCVVIDHTVEREQLWHALTPQVFRYGALQQALTACLAQDLSVTDEASAMEQQGYQPLLVAGRSDNIKVTRREDLALAELFLSTSLSPHS
ncbi:2-C-methyl-D-erythritol 4-phosphate cytidylyltransferase [Thalassolituus pacificus]|uniref:2-C-methyl-D-erythritol 4-phosphate cytidylyltransferase n=1 Tax=Thalassolituus pacificus TaxID=2975440 RepID=A0A9X2WEM9_9GAMM|nr:2-C-methyl-D-erythritol 4-phosphate cytidylyltransferase [Thalassolituus pacificus]MCT7358317.1 2-C-methyl-D-erythritol 4-phosphate cytidylyltransferase [Thalassolituus pacificus]